MKIDDLFIFKFFKIFININKNYVFKIFVFDFFLGFE